MDAEGLQCREGEDNASDATCLPRREKNEQTVVGWGLRLVRSYKLLQHARRRGKFSRFRGRSIWVLITIVAFAIVYGIYTLSDPRRTTIPANEKNWPEKLEPSVKKLSSEEQNLFARFLRRTKLAEAFAAGGGVQKGLTIAEAILSQQRFELAEADARVEATKLKGTLTATSNEKRFVPSEHSANGNEGAIEVEFVYHNVGNKDIAGFKGVISFADSTGDVIREERINHNKELPAGKSVSWARTVRFERFDKSSERLRSIDLSSLKFSFAPQTVVFADGTIVQAPYNERVR